MKTLFVVLSLSVATLVAIGQVPQSFNYQFVARDNSGEILSNTPLGIRISIRENSSDGEISYQETFTKTTNQFGLINMEVGSGTVVLGNFSTLNWGGSSKFIETEIDPNGGTNYVTIGTTQLLSVPYALYAERSKDSPWELSGDDLYYNSGKIGLGTSSPLFTLDVRNLNEGETADVGVHTDSDLAGGALSAYSNGFPEPLSHFAGRLSLWSNGMTATGLDLRADGVSSDIRLYTGGFFATNERMRITPEGYVGVGSTAPETRLQVNNTSQFSPDLTAYGAKGNLFLTHLNSGMQLGPFGPALAFSGFNTTRRRAAIASVETSGDADQVGLAFFTHPGTLSNDETVVEYMRLTHDGNLGIGIDAPETMLHINTDTRFDPGNYSGRNKGGLLLSQIGGMTGYHQFGSALAFSGINTSRRRAAIAAIQSGWDSDEVGLAFFTSPGTAATTNQVSQWMVITHEGLVGINNETPTHRLDVKGNIVVRDESSGIISVEIGTGLDYAEGFYVSNLENVQPGTVLSIDTENPGKLKICEEAYDTKVAGIVAGANQIGSGIILGKGQFDCNVALAGRVYCYVDATNEAVNVGDLLTTSTRPGYAKKVSDPMKAQGAIIGKAMQSMAPGATGQILVLVTLQ